MVCKWQRDKIEQQITRRKQGNIRFSDANETILENSHHSTNNKIKYVKQEGAELCQAQPTKHKLFGSNGAIFFGLNY